MHTHDAHNSNVTRRARFALPIIAAAMVLACAGIASAQAPSTAPKDVTPKEDPTIAERLGDQVPLDVTLTTHTGEQTTIGELLESDKPAIITPIYFRCPQLCSLTLNGLLTALEDLELTAGEDFQILTFSFNPDEGPELATVKRQAYLSVYKRDAADEGGWQFLTGRRDQIERLCEGVGFEYTHDEQTGEYVHPPAVIFVTSDGRISRYMSDVMFAPRDVRLALIEASEGTIGSPMERFALRLCYQYDPDTNSYVASAWKIMRLGGAITVLALGTVLGVLFYLDYRARRARNDGEMAAPQGGSMPAMDGSST